MMLREDPTREGRGEGVEMIVTWEGWKGASSKGRIWGGVRGTWEGMGEGDENEGKLWDMGKGGGWVCVCEWIGGWDWRGEGGR